MQIRPVVGALGLRDDVIDLFAWLPASAAAEGFLSQDLGADLLPLRSVAAVSRRAAPLVIGSLAFRAEASTHCAVRAVRTAAAWTAKGRRQSGQAPDVAFVEEAMPTVASIDAVAAVVHVAEAVANLKAAIGALAKRVWRRRHVLNASCNRWRAGVASIWLQEEDHRQIAGVAKHWPAVIAGQLRIGRLAVDHRKPSTDQRVVSTNRGLRIW